MNYLPFLSEASAPAPDADLARLEALTGTALPQAYAAFLRQSNGGVFSSELVDIPATGDEPANVTVLNYMFSTAGSDYNLFEEYRTLRNMDRIPTRTLPIADDPGGNLFLLSLEDSDFGAVYFWDHEREPALAGDGIADYPNMTRIADDFSTFIASLRDDQ